MHKMQTLFIYSRQSKVTSWHRFCVYFCAEGSQTYKHGDYHSRPDAVAAFSVCSR